MDPNGPFHGVLRRNPKNPRYFTDDTGRAVYLAGSHTWAVMQDIWLEGKPRRRMDYEGFLQMMEDYGHNFLRFWQWMAPRGAAWDRPGERTLFDPLPYARTGPGTARDGKPMFDLSKWDESYFERLRGRVAKAGERGIYVSVMLLEGWSVKSAHGDEDDTWPGHPFNGANNVNGITDDPRAENGRNTGYCSLKCPQLLALQKKFIRKVLETLGGLDNVLYEIANEMPNTRDAMEWTDHLCAFVKETEKDMPKRHPVGATAEGDHQRNEELFAMCADWISPGTGECYEYRYNPPPADGSKVILSDTDHLWGHGCETPWIWKSFTRGMNLLFMDPWEPIPGDRYWWWEGGVTKNQRYYYAWDDMRRNLGYTRRFAEKLDLNACVPRPDVCTSTYCLADEGREYLCYLPTAYPEGLRLGSSGGRPFKLTYFDPETGMYADGGEISGDWKQLLVSPFKGHAVAWLKRTEG